MRKKIFVAGKVNEIKVLWKWNKTNPRISLHSRDGLKFMVFLPAKITNVYRHAQEKKKSKRQKTEKEVIQDPVNQPHFVKFTHFLDINENFSSC